MATYYTSLTEVAFDWDGDQLHTFTVDWRRYADPFFGLEECADESRVRLGKLLPRAGGRMSYVYDIGDWWEHQITVEVGSGRPDCPQMPGPRT